MSDVAPPPPKIILVTGGVISGVGKGIVSSSLGVILKANGYRVSAIKIDPYLNVDAGTFSPWEHGEVFVLDDGGEVDLDLGNYERFLNVCLTRDNNITTGKVYQRVIQKERAGGYLGKTVQIVPHLTDGIRNWVEEVAKRPVDSSGKQPDVCIVELGGVVGDIESQVYMHAMSQFTHPKYHGRFMHVHVTLLIDRQDTTGELKTKPGQNGVSCVNSYHLRPDIVIARSHRPIATALRDRFADSCRLEAEQLINVYDVSNIYRVPLMLMEQGVLGLVRRTLSLPGVAPDQALQNCPNVVQWTQLADLVDKKYPTVKIALVGKYIKLEHVQDGQGEPMVFKDAYASVIKAIKHSGTAAEMEVEILYIPSDELEPEADPAKGAKAWQMLRSAAGILVPGGFGKRGVTGKILACEYARTNKIPFLGVCLGMQCAAIEFARNVCGITRADTTEDNQDKGLTPQEQVVVDMPEHTGKDMGGTMRLGRRATVFLTENSKLYKLYGNHDAIEERHRHRYEVNPKLVPLLHEAGLYFVGMGVDETNPSTEGHVSAASNRALLRLACHRDTNSEASFLTKVKELCSRGEHSGTAVRMEMLELADHPYYVGVQYHPEYTSHPLAPSPPFLGLVLAASGKLQGFLDGSARPHPLQVFQGVEGSFSSNFHFLPSAGNSSASLLALLSENSLRVTAGDGHELKVPANAHPSPPNGEENRTPVFSLSNP